MMTKDDLIAKQIKTQALIAIQDLARIFDIEGFSGFKDYDHIKEGICKVISEIDGSLLLTIYQKYPQLDDLNEKT